MGGQANRRRERRQRLGHALAARGVSPCKALRRSCSALVPSLLTPTPFSRPRPPWRNERGDQGDGLAARTWVAALMRRADYWPWRFGSGPVNVRRTLAPSPCLDADRPVKQSLFLLIGASVPRTPTHAALELPKTRITLDGFSDGCDSKPARARGLGRGLRQRTGGAFPSGAVAFALSLGALRNSDISPHSPSR